MSHLRGCEKRIYTNFAIYTMIWWEHVHENVGAHANSDHHIPPHTSMNVR